MVEAPNMIVMKFGGTSVGSAENIARVALIIKKAIESHPIVVVSAVTKMTDALILLAEESSQGGGEHTFNRIKTTHGNIVSELNLPPALLHDEFEELTSLVEATRHNLSLDKKVRDHFQSFGERMCAKIVAAMLNKDRIASKAFPAWEIGMITNDEFGDAEPLPESYAVIKKEIALLDVIPVVTGFIGKTKKGEITTLGRGGSDYSAAVIGSAVGAARIQIWKEVDGFLTTDPRIVPEAKIVPELAFEEACELAYFGAKVLHPKTIIPAMEKDIPVQVLNTFNPDGEGTTIVGNFSQRRLKSHSIEALTLKKAVIVVHIHTPEFFDNNGLMAQVFNTFDKHKTNIDIIATSVASISLAITDDSNLEEIVRELEDVGTVEIERRKAVICAVGGSINAAGVAGRMFTVLGDNQIAVEMISQASSGYSITFVVKDESAEWALRILHAEYFRHS